MFAQNRVNLLTADPRGLLTSNQATGERYRWLSEEGSESRTRSPINEDYQLSNTRTSGRSVTLYARGEAVAVA